MGTPVNRANAGVLVTGALLLPSADAETHGNGVDGLTRDNALNYLEQAVELFLGVGTAE